MRRLPAKEAAGAVGKSSIEFRRAGTKRFRLHFPPSDTPDESHCDHCLVLSTRPSTCRGASRLSPQIFAPNDSLYIGGIRDEQGLRVHNCRSQRNPRHSGYACSLRKLIHQQHHYGCSRKASWYETVAVSTPIPVPKPQVGSKYSKLASKTSAHLPIKRAAPPRNLQQMTVCMI